MKRNMVPFHVLHYRFEKHCIKELQTVLECQKVFVNDIILRLLGSPS